MYWLHMYLCAPHTTAVMHSIQVHILYNAIHYNAFESSRVDVQYSTAQLYSLACSTNVTVALTRHMELYICTCTCTPAACQYSHAVHAQARLHTHRQGLVGVV